MRVGDLGPLELYGASTRLLGRRAAVALGVLLWSDQPVPSDRLADIVWGDDQPADPREALHVLVWRLRRVLEPDRGRGDRPTLLVSSPAGYVLLVRTDQIDSRCFEALMGEARALLASRQPDAALEHLESALALWRGHPLGDLGYEPWARPFAARLLEARTNALELRLDALSDLGREHEVSAESEYLVTEHPTREGMWARRARALYRIGDQASALRTLHAARAYLADELGVAPGPELTALERQILEHDATLLPPPSPPVAATTAGHDGPRRRDLPRPRSTYVGRDVETRRVERLLARGKPVTVTGPGGVGKTRLAIEAARAAAPVFDGGLALVDLTRATSDSDVVTTAARDLGFAGDANSYAALVASLAGVHLLVVVDNCEHVVHGAAQLVTALNDAVGVSILATSRCPLGVDGEQIVPLGSLGAPHGDGTAATRREHPAVQLLLDRSAAAGAELDAGSETLRRLTKLVAQVDGLPLGLELIAASLGALDVDEVSRCLREGADLPPAPGVGRPARHRTLDALVAPSYDACSAPERELLDRLSARGAPFDLALARSVGDRAGINAIEVARCLATLVHHSLVMTTHVRGEPRMYRILEPIRGFVLRVADPDTIADARQHLASLSAAPRRRRSAHRDRAPRRSEQGAR